MKTSYCLTLLPVALVLGGCASIGSVEPSTRRTVSIFRTRLNNGRYISPSGEYSVRVPPLAQPGAKMEERQVSPTVQGVFFADDFRKIWYVLRTDNRKEKLTLDKAEDHYNIGDTFRQKEFVTTSRGRELRFVAIEPGGSPLVAHTKENGRSVERKNDLITASSIFIHQDDIYPVAAALTPLTSESETDLMERAKKRLEEFLEGLEIKDQGPPK